MGKGGRKPAGPNGELVSEYPQVSVRVPEQTRAELKALAIVHNQNLSLMMKQLIENSVQNLSGQQRELLDALVKKFVDAKQNTAKD